MVRDVFFFALCFFNVFCCQGDMCGTVKHNCTQCAADWCPLLFLFPLAGGGLRGEKEAAQQGEIVLILLLFRHWPHSFID